MPANYRSNEFQQDDARGHRIASPVVGDPVTIRSNVISNDSANPAVGTGKSFVGFRYIEVEFAVSGTNPVWVVTPLLMNSDRTAYMEGEAITLSGAKSSVYMLNVNGSPGVNFKCNGSSGTNPAITIKARGFN